MLFAFDLVVCENKAEYQVERWRDVLGRHGWWTDGSRQRTCHLRTQNWYCNCIYLFYLFIMSYLPRSKVGEEEIPSRNTFKYIGSIWRLREGQKEIARTELNCHGVNGEKQRVSLLSQESAGKAESDALPGSIQTHHGIRCRMLGHEKERGTSSK